MERKRARAGASTFYKTPYGKVSAKGMAKLKRAKSTRNIVAKDAPLLKQVKGLLSSRTRDALDQIRTLSTGVTTTAVCLTSSTSVSAAANGSGLLACDADEVMVNSVRLKGLLENRAVIDADPVANFNPIVRKIIVWFYKPRTQPSAGGTLPPVTEVLLADTIQSAYLQSVQNGGSFTVLSDRYWNLGENTYTTVGTGMRVAGANRKLYDYTVKIGKKCKFVRPSDETTNPGGHYSTTSNNGQVSRGLLVLYSLYTMSGSTQLDESYLSRLNYTG